MKVYRLKERREIPGIVRAIYLPRMQTHPRNFVQSLLVASLQRVIDLADDEALSLEQRERMVRIYLDLQDMAADTVLAFGLWSGVTLTSMFLFTSLCGDWLRYTVPWPFTTLSFMAAWFMIAMILQRVVHGGLKYRLRVVAQALVGGLMLDLDTTREQVIADLEVIAKRFTTLEVEAGILKEALRHHGGVHV